MRRTSLPSRLRRRAVRGLLVAARTTASRPPCSTCATPARRRHPRSRRRLRRLCLHASESHERRWIGSGTPMVRVAGDRRGTIAERFGGPRVPGSRPALAGRATRGVRHLEDRRELRGCVGQLVARFPLFEAVREAATSAAFRDSRFFPLAEDELPRVQIEVSVLSPLEKLEWRTRTTCSRRCVRAWTDWCSRTTSARACSSQMWKQLPDPHEFLFHLKRKAHFLRTGGCRARRWSDSRRNMGRSGVNDSHPGKWCTAGRRRVQCDLCPRDCKLNEGQRGFCFVRAPRATRWWLKTYGRSSGFCVDPIEKKPLAHFFPGTSVLSFGTAAATWAAASVRTGHLPGTQWDKLADQATPEPSPRARRRWAASRSPSPTTTHIFAEYAIDVARRARAGPEDRGVTAATSTRPPARAVLGDGRGQRRLKAFTKTSTSASPSPTCSPCSRPSSTW